MRDRISPCGKSPFGYIFPQVPRKIRELVSELEKAGFALVKGGKGSHRKFRHSQVQGFALLSGKTGDDAKPYQEKHVAEKIEESLS